MSKEAKARIKINELLKEAGWRLLDTEKESANVILEGNVKITEKLLTESGEDFDKIKNGFMDYLLLDKKGFPIAVLEAKSESKEPLDGKEQARTYALSVGKNCRFIILSNGNCHYLWDLLIGNPKRIHTFPTIEDLEINDKYQPNPYSLIHEKIEHDFITRTQKFDYDKDPNWLNEKLRKDFVEHNNLKFLRPFQIKAVQAIQKTVKEENKSRFLFEMATGTGKTLTSAAVIKLFFKTGAANRVLFLVDRIELEQQAKEAFDKYLKPDYLSTIFKESRHDNLWKKFNIVVSTVQTLTKNNLYKRVFKPSDFDLIISDESHRSISGNARAVFEYFMGYKLGLTATPRNYLKKFDSVNAKDPRELERRMLLDTYSIFGCDNGVPTFSYTLLDGVTDGYLINPIVVDARTDITTQLLSDEGYSVFLKTDEELESVDTEGDVEDEKEISQINYFSRDFEKKFFSERTNRIFCETFLQNALRDPITGEIGKSIIFCVSQKHAAHVANILNELAHEIFKGKYQSDFAVQVTSNVRDAQQFTKDFTHNRLKGTANFNPLYKTAKGRICVTVGMMTTGYDCPDILNLGLMRPIFSPTDFVQIKGRGTRKHDFMDKIILQDKALGEQFGKPQKTKFKLFDFFANCEYFEEKFDYDEILKLPAILKEKKESQNTSNTEGGVFYEDEVAYESSRTDWITKLTQTQIGLEGMKIDRKLFENYEDVVKHDDVLRKLVESGNQTAAAEYVLNHIFEKANDFFNLEKLRKAIQSDRRISIWETLLKAYGLIPYIKNKEELLNDAFDTFDSRFLPEVEHFQNAKNFFKSYITDAEIREIIEKKQFALLNTNANGDVFRKLPTELRQLIPEYIKDYVSLNAFMS
jgi:type I restriction enzyme, R subunit